MKGSAASQTADTVLPWAWSANVSGRHELRSRGARAAKVYPRAHAVAGVLKTAFVNPDLRRVGAGYALFGTAELAIWIALLVYAYDHGGTAASTTMVLVQLLPCVLLGPFLGAYADRHRPLRVLTGGYALQVVAMDAVATAMVLHAPVVTSSSSRR